MNAFAEAAVALGILRVAQPLHARFPGRNGAPGMPFIADVRGAPADLDLRRLIVREMVRRFRRDFETADMVIGLAKAGIAWGMLVAWELGLPAGVVHLDGPRKSGLRRQVEGSVTGRQVVLIDNLTCTHSSLITAARIIESEGGAVAGAMTVVGLETGPASFLVSTLCTEAELEAEGMRQGILLPAHLHGRAEGGAVVPPEGGRQSSIRNAKEAKMTDKITRYEQSGLLIRSGGKTLAVDIGKLTSARAVKAMPKPDALLVSHKHPDHFCPDHLQTLGAPIFAPEDVLALLHEGAEATAIRPGEPIDVAGFTVTAFEVDHGPKLSAPIENFGYIIRFPNGRRLCFAGDIARQGTPLTGAFDIVVLPVSGAGFVFTATEALAYLERIGHSGHVLPVHDSGPSDPDAVARFAALAPEHLDVIALAVGEAAEVPA